MHYSSECVDGDTDIYSRWYMYACEFVCADDQSEHITHRGGKQPSVAGKAIDSPFPY